METSAVLNLAGWYSSHWSIAPASVHSRPFVISSSRRVTQPLAGLHDLYSRAAFLLGVASGLPVEKPATTAGVAAPPETAPRAPGRAAGVADRPISSPSKSLHIRGKPPSQPAPAAGPVHPKEEPDPAAFPAEKEKVETATVPEPFPAAAEKAEVFVEAVSRLGQAFETHEFLSAEMREYGTELISRFADNLAPYGLSRAEGSLQVDRERLAGAFQENPQQAAEAFWGPNSLTPDITSLAAAIVGAPGAYLLEAGPQAPQTYPPFQAINPWFRVAPTGFYQVA